MIDIEISDRTLLAIALCLFLLLVFIRATSNYLQCVKSRRDYLSMLNDLEVGLRIEEEHCLEHEFRHGQSLKNTIREQSKQKYGVSYSGRFTLSRIRLLRERESRQYEKFIRPLERLNLVGVLKFFKVIS